MKFIWILVVLFNITDCKNNEDAITQQPEWILEYKATSRGTYQNIKIDKKIIEVTNVRSGNPKSSSIEKKDWDNLQNILKSINIEELPQLKPPSQDHQFDGAALAELIITKDNKTYETQTFDHGNPPATISKLVKEMLSLAEKIE